MYLEQLEYIKALSKFKSINTASNHLHLSQQALSFSIQSLEKELNIKLLERSSSGIKITPGGEEVLSVAKDIITQWHDLQNRLLAYQDAKINQPFKILLPQMASSQILQKYINHYTKKYPNTPIALNTETLDHILENHPLYTDLYDLVMLSLWFKNDEPIGLQLPNNSDFIPLSQENLSLFVHKNSPLAKQKYITIKRLNQLPVVTWASRKDSPHITQFLQALGLEKPDISSDINYCMQGLLDNCFTLFCVSGTLSELFNHPDTVAIPPKSEIKLLIGYLLPANHTLSENATYFIDLFAPAVD